MRPTPPPACFDRAIVGLMEQLKAGVTRGKARWMEMKAPTLYALLLKSRKRRRAEMEEEAKEGDEEVKEGEDEGQGGVEGVTEEEDERERGVEEEGGEGEGLSTAAALLSQLNSDGAVRRGVRRV